MIVTLFVFFFFLPLHWWDVTWATWVLVVVGGFAAFVALRTLADIKEQTRNAQKAADAALVNAQAVRASERAWVIVEKPDRVQTFETSDNKTVINFSLTYSNQGRTMCWVTEKKVHFAIVERLPKEPMFDETSLIFSNPEPEPLVVGQKSSLEGRNLACNGVHLMVLNPVDEDSFKGNVPVLYGAIKYRDPLGDDRLTLFGYQIKIGTHVDYIHSALYNNNT